MASEAATCLQAYNLSPVLGIVGSFIPATPEELCFAIATIAPLVAYPFLPYRERWDGRYSPAETLFALATGNLIGLLSWTSFELWDDVFESTAAPIPEPMRPFCLTWPLYLTVFTLVASHPAMKFSEKKPLRPSDFSSAGLWVVGTLSLCAPKILDTIFFECRDSWYTFAIPIPFIMSISNRVAGHVRTYTHTFITRNSSYPVWFWQPPRGTDDFDPAWSLVLSLALSFALLALNLGGLYYALGDRITGLLPLFSLYRAT